MAVRGRRIENFDKFGFLEPVCCKKRAKNVPTKKLVWGINHETMPMLLFWKLVEENQMSQPPEATRNHNSSKFSIVLPLRAI